VRLARIAGRQHGVVTSRQLAALGIRGTSVKRRVAGGRLVVLSHLDAAALWQIYESRGSSIHVTGMSRSGRKLPGVWAHRTRTFDPADVTVKDGIPVTTVARTIIDLTDILNSDRVLRAIREAEYLRLLDLDTLIAAVQRGDGRHNLVVLNKALARYRPGQIVREELEHRFLELVHAAGLPEPQTNVRVQTKRRKYRVDCLWATEGVAVELDGRDAHARETAFEEDRARDAALSAIGLRPLRFTWHRVTREGAEVIAELQAILGRARAARCAMPASGPPIGGVGSDRERGIVCPR
jgi:very-short-patch-repair endonuclease